MANVVVMVAVSAMIVIVTTAIASSAATAVVVSAVDADVADDAVAGRRAAGLRQLRCHRPHQSRWSRRPSRSP